MSKTQRVLDLAIVAAVVLFVAPFAIAQPPNGVPNQPQLPQRITPEQRKEVADINKSIRDANGLIRRKKLDEGEKALDDAEARLDTLVEGGLPETDRMVAIAKRTLGLARRALALQRGEKPPMLGTSFTEEIAPIIKENCLKCHGENDPKGGLDLSTFAGWKKGGESRMPLGRVLIPRLTANPPQRMPKGGPALDIKQIQTIARWIQEGTKFDGKSETAPIGEGTDGDESMEEEKIEVPKATGQETVSFTKDVAPFVVNICGQCHMNDDPRGGYDMSTIEGILRGGESGQVIVPGNPEESRLWLMVSNQEQPRMPPGQRRITRENYDALTTWIREGAKYDGDDPKESLREVVPSAGEMQAESLANLSPEEFAEHRKTRSDEHWKRAFPDETVEPIVSEEFLIYTNAPTTRADQISRWANSHAATLRTAFGTKEKPIWKGKLGIFVAKDRFGYQEFAMAVNQREQVPDNIHGHTVVTDGLDDAYIVLEDVGDDTSKTSPGMKAEVVNLVSQAFVEQMSGDMPDWVVQGTGLYLASQSNPENPYYPELKTKLASALSEIQKPEEIFEEGTFAPADAPVVALALVEFLIRRQGPAKYAQFLQTLAKDSDMAKAIQSVYGTTPAGLAAAFGQSGAGR